MLNLAVARRYAQALFDLAREQDQLDQVEQDLQLVVGQIEENPEVGEVLKHRLIAAAVKMDLVRQVFAGRVSPLTLNFLGVVTRRRREFHLTEMFEQYRILANEARGLTEVSLRTAAEVPEENLAALRDALASHLGKQVTLKTALDPELMGGVVVQVGDTLMDGSVRTRLKRLGDRLRRARVKEQG